MVRRLHEAELGEVAEPRSTGRCGRLFRSGLLTSYVVASDAGPHRKYYGSPAPGWPAPEQARDEWLSFSSALTGLVGTVGTVDSRHITREDE